jgi:hypothetical protein
MILKSDFHDYYDHMFDLPGFSTGPHVYRRRKQVKYITRETLLANRECYFKKQVDHLLAGRTRIALQQYRVGTSAPVGTRSRHFSRACSRPLTAYLPAAIAR